MWEGIDNRAEIPRATSGDRYYWVRIKGIGEFSDETPDGAGFALAPTSITAGFRIEIDRAFHNRILVGTGSGTTNQQTTVTPINANGSVTYAWVRTSGSNKISVVNNAAQTTGFQASGFSNGEIQSAEFEVEGEDTTPDTDVKTVTVRFERNDSFQA